MKIIFKEWTNSIRTVKTLSSLCSCQRPIKISQPTPDRLTTYARYLRKTLLRSREINRTSSSHNPAKAGKLVPSSHYRTKCRLGSSIRDHLLAARASRSGSGRVRNLGPSATAPTSNSPKFKPLQAKTRLRKTLQKSWPSLRPILKRVKFNKKFKPSHRKRGRPLKTTWSSAPSISISSTVSSPGSSWCTSSWCSSQRGRWCSKSRPRTPTRPRWVWPSTSSSCQRTPIRIHQQKLASQSSSTISLTWENSWLVPLTTTCNCRRRKTRS